MRTSHITLAASAVLQSVRFSGRGCVTLLTISHAEASPQAVSIYAGDGTTLLAQYIVDPGQSPYTLQYPRGQELWFANGLQVLTGSCVVNLAVVW